MSDIVTGDDVSLSVTLKIDELTFIIDPAATIQASLVSNDKKTIIIAPVAVLEANAGSDWPNSLIVVEFTSVETTGIQCGQAKLEMQILEGGKTSTFFVSVDVEKGTI